MNARKRLKEEQEEERRRLEQMDRRVRDAKIRQDYYDGYSKEELAEIYNLHISTIGLILSKRDDDKSLLSKERNKHQKTDLDEVVKNLREEGVSYAERQRQNTLRMLREQKLLENRYR